MHRGASHRYDCHRRYWVRVYNNNVIMKIPLINNKGQCRLRGKGKNCLLCRTNTAWRDQLDAYELPDGWPDCPHGITAETAAELSVSATAQPVSNTYKLPASGVGPGDFLHRAIVKRFKVQPCDACLEMIRKMNRWGPAECRRREDEIVRHLMGQTNRLGKLLSLATRIPGGRQVEYEARRIVRAACAAADKVAAEGLKHGHKTNGPVADPSKPPSPQDATEGDSEGEAMYASEQKPVKKQQPRGYGWRRKRVPTMREKMGLPLRRHPDPERHRQLEEEAQARRQYGKAVQSIGPADDETIEVVYPFGHSQYDDRELMYSIRSLKNIDAKLRIWIVGEKPKWLQRTDESLVFVPRPHSGKSRWIDSVLRVMAAVNHPSFGDRFILMNDDMYFVKPTPLDVLARPFSGRAWTREALKKWNPDHGWDKQRRQSMLLLNMDKVYDFATHMPNMMDTDKFRRTAEQFDFGKKVREIQIIYWNLHRQHTPKPAPIARVRSRISMSETPTDIYYMKKRCENHYVLNHVSNRFTGYVELFLHHILKTPTRWELPCQQ